MQKAGEEIFEECGGEALFARGQAPMPPYWIENHSHVTDQGEMDITELPTFTKHTFSVFHTPQARDQEACREASTGWFSYCACTQELGNALAATSFWCVCWPMCPCCLPTAIVKTSLLRRMPHRPFVMKVAPWHLVQGFRGFDSGFTGTNRSTFQSQMGLAD